MSHASPRASSSPSWTRVAVLQMTTNPEGARVAHEVRERLGRVKAALGGGSPADAKG